MSLRPSITRIYNGRLYRDHCLVKEDLWIADGKIVGAQEQADREIDAEGMVIAPGFIDLQINGGFGIDLTNEPERVEELAKQLPQHGVSCFCPTIVSSEAEVYEKAIPLLQPRAVEGGASIAGIHLEGPFLNPEKRGAHRPSCIASCEGGYGAALQRYGSLEGVKLVTLAPELPGALELIHQLSRDGITVAAGHSLATAEQSEAAVEAGLRLVTHLFNCVGPWHQRQPGLIGTALTTPGLSYSLILDGQHLHPQSVQLAWRSNPEGLILVTDAMAALGLAPGEYQLAGAEVEVGEERACLKGTQTLAGAICPLDACLRRFRALTQCSIPEALELVTERPAQLIGVADRKGHLRPGADADFVLLDDTLHVHTTYIPNLLRDTIFGKEKAPGIERS